MRVNDVEVKVFDMGVGADRYEVVLNGSYIYSMSENANQANGVCMFMGRILNEYKTIGKEIKYEDAPEGLRKQTNFLTKHYQFYTKKELSSVILLNTTLVKRT